MERLKNLKFKKLSSNGDTIVEVMIVLAILALAFAISYGTANGGLRKSRSSQEHSQALGIINSQVETARKAVALGQNLDLGHNFCLTTPAAAPSADGAASCQVGRYAITNSYQDGYFKFQINWPGVGGLGPQQETITYKMEPLANGGSNPWGNPPPATGGATGPGYNDEGPYHWGINAGNYVKTSPAFGCDPAEPILASPSNPDTHNGCFTLLDANAPTAHDPRQNTAMHAWRDFKATYNFASGFEDRPPFKPGGSPYTFSIASRQYEGTIPAGYKFNVTVTFLNASNGVLGVINPQLTPRTAPAYDTTKTPITLSERPARIVVEWTNNLGNDPNLEMINLQLFRNLPPPTPSPAVVDKPSYRFPAWHLAAEGGDRRYVGFVFTNPSPEANLNLAGATISGRSDSFNIIDNRCSGLSLPPGDSCVVYVQFAPPTGGEVNRFANQGDRQATLTLNNSNGVAATSATMYGKTWSNILRGNYNETMTYGTELKALNEGCYNGGVCCYNNADTCPTSFLMQWDGNMSILYNGCRRLWFGGVPGQDTFVMQTDGNAVLYAPWSHVWASWTNGNPGSNWLVGDGFAGVLNPGGSAWLYLLDVRNGLPCI